MSTALQGKIVLVTGAGKGSGRSIAIALAGRGALIAANDISPINLDETVASINQAGGTARAYVDDIAKKMLVQGLLRQVEETLGVPDIVVHCAEVEPQKSILEMDDWDWQRVQEVNLGGAFLLLQTAGRMMQAKGGGTIILLGDRAKGAEKRAAYFASKAALAALARLARAEFAPLGVQVFHAEQAEQALEILGP